MSQHRCEAFVVELNRNVGKHLAQLGYKLLHTRKVLARLAVKLLRLTHNDTFYALTSHVILQETHKFARSNCRQSASYDL